MPGASARALVAGSLALIAGRPGMAHVIVVGGPGLPDLAQAIAAVPALRPTLRPGEPIEIVLPAGTLRLVTAVTIDAAHGGTPDHPLRICGAGAGATRLTGAVVVVSRAITAADGAGLPPGARAIDLDATMPAPAIAPRGWNGGPQPAGFAMFQGQRQFQPSRWPVTGYAIGLATAAPGGVVVTAPADRLAAWRSEPALSVAGYWAADWAYRRVAVAAVGPEGLRLAVMGDVPRPQVRFAVENALAELRQPGRFVVQPARRRVLFLPAGDAAAEIAQAAGLLRIVGAGDIRISDITFERTLDAAIRVEGGHDIGLERIVVRQTGSDGIVVVGGRDVVIRRSAIAATAERGIVLAGGDRVTLTLGGHRFDEGIVTRFGQAMPSYRPGVLLQGVGNALMGSRITQGDHSAVMLSGNDLSVTDSEIAEVLRDSDDAGAIYLGRDWTQRGIRIAGNYIHDLGTPGERRTQLSAVYLDDQFSGVAVTGNLLIGGGYGVMIGGGRDNRVTDNLFVTPGVAAVHVDDRGISTDRGQTAGLIASMARMPVGGAAWRARYPVLAALRPAEYGVPAGNVLAGNGVQGARLLAAIPSSVAAMVALADNVLIGGGAADGAIAWSQMPYDLRARFAPLVTRGAALAPVAAMLAAAETPDPAAIVPRSGCDDR